jgi:surface polysaccharide O-acyltransferase-like enzyme
VHFGRETPIWFFSLRRVDGLTITDSITKAQFRQRITEVPIGNVSPSFHKTFNYIIYLLMGQIVGHHTITKSKSKVIAGVLFCAVFIITLIVTVIIAVIVTVTNDQLGLVVMLAALANVSLVLPFSLRMLERNLILGYHSRPLLSASAVMTSDKA